MTLQGDAQGELLFCKLGRENSELVDLRRFGKQVAGPRFFHQRRRHLAVEMRVAPGLVVERVEDGERGRSLLNGEPRDRAHLSVHQGYRGTEKIRDLLLLARLRLQRNVQCKFCHHSLLLGQGPSGTKTCTTHFAPPTLSTFTSLTVTDQLGEGTRTRMLWQYCLAWRGLALIANRQGRALFNNDPTGSPQDQANRSNTA